MSYFLNPSKTELSPLVEIYKRKFLFKKVSSKYFLFFIIFRINIPNIYISWSFTNLFPNNKRLITSKFVICFRNLLFSFFNSFKWIDKYWIYWIPTLVGCYYFY
uniref:Uncharacterized protein n=1 Tax=Meloidogyne incognita TaxID=6306 RepID=A0A914KWB3_MELIC